MKSVIALGGAASLSPILWSEETSGGLSGPKIKITSVKTFHLKHKLRRPFGVSVSVPLSTTREALLVKIQTDSGLVGWGESAPISGARETIENHLGPSLIGQNPLRYRPLLRKMWGPNFGHALAIGALDTALNDLRGKALHLPVAELFGGRLRDRVPVYASAMNYLEDSRPEDQFPKEALHLVGQGYKALKMRLGRYEVKRESAVAAAVRDAVGPEIRLMADGNAAYTMRTALQMGHELDQLDFEFFEEPLPQSPLYAGYEELRRKLPLPLAAGEVVNSRAAAKSLIDRRVMDIIQPDLSLCGGIEEALFISQMASLSSIRCLPHCWGGAVVIGATLHLISLLPDPHWGFPTDTPMLELDLSENPWRSEIVKEPFHIDPDGMMKVPTSPGLGVEIDEEAVKSYAI